ncbi:VOC family protein [Aquimarina rhabdastrellae]
METRLLQIHPVLPVEDIYKTITFYEEKLGFKKVFESTQYEAGEMNYAVVALQEIQVHFQVFETIKDIKMPQFRVQVIQIEAIYELYKTKGVLQWNAALIQTPWGTKEFAFYDCNQVGWTFFENNK